MKNKFILSAALIIAMVFSGCSSDSSGADVETTLSESETTTIENETTEKENELSEQPNEETTQESTTDETDISADREPIVRNVCWGDTIDIVKSVETEELVDETSTELLYHTDLTGYSSALLYYIDEEYGLYEVVYLSDPLSSGRTAYGAYNKIVDAVSSKYDEPVSNDSAIIDSLYDYCRDDYEALELGCIAYTAKWEYTDTKITLMLASIDYKLQTYLKFETTSFEPSVNTDGL